MRKIFIIKISFILLTMQHICFAQTADAGPDKVNCNKKGVKIGGVGDPSWCYSWKPETGLDDPKILNPIASPTTKTTYTLTATGPDFSFKATDDVEVDVIEFVDVQFKRDVENASLFTKDGGGSVCLGQTYNFKVNTIPSPTTATLSWDLYDLDFFNEIIASGTGTTFNHTFSGDLQEGTTRARFYYDENSNSKFDDDECSIDTEFEVKEVTSHSVSVAQPSSISGVSNGSVDAILSGGTALLDVRNATIDYRCCTKFVRSGSVSTYTPSPTTPDEVNSGADFENLISKVSATIRIVRRITWCGGPATPGFVIAGCANVGSPNTIVVASGTGAGVWIHEIGHTLGLGHRDDNAANLMHSVSGAGNLVNESECGNFE